MSLNHRETCRHAGSVRTRSFVGPACVADAQTIVPSPRKPDWARFAGTAPALDPAGDLVRPHDHHGGALLIHEVHVGCRRCLASSRPSARRARRSPRRRQRPRGSFHFVSVVEDQRFTVPIRVEPTYTSTEPQAEHVVAATATRRKGPAAPRRWGLAGSTTRACTGASMAGTPNTLADRQRVGSLLHRAVAWALRRMGSTSRLSACVR